MAGTSYQIFGDASNLLTELKKSEKAFTDLNKTAERSGQGIDDVMNKLEGLAKKAGVSFGAAGMAALAKKVADVRGEFQQLEIAFGTMLGSTDKANKLMIQLANTAAKTPFDLQGIAQGAKQLIAYGVAAEEINSTIVSLGDVAAGLSLPLNDLVYLYGTTMVQGKMFTNDLKQLQGRGVPILDALADQLDIAKNEVSEYVSAGRVSADVFKAAMLSMSQEGGKFAGLMAAQSASITGQISNIQDGIAMMFNEIGQQSEGAINGILSGVSALVENYEVVGKSIVALAGTYGMYKAALVVVTALENARFVVVNNGKQIGLMKLLTAATWEQVKAQLASNAAMLANPAVLVTAGIVALVGAIVGLNKLITLSADEMGRANKQHQKRIEKIDEEKNKAYELIGVIEDENSSYYELAAARGELNELEAFKGMNVKSMTGEQIRARIKEWEELEIAAANAKQKEDAINIVGSARQKYVQADGTLQNEDKVLESAKTARKLLIDEEVGNLPVEYDARIKYIEDRIKEEENLLKQSNEKLAELDTSWWDRATGKAISGQQRDDLMAGATYDQEMSSFALTQWKSVLENTTQKLKDDAKASEDNKGESLAKVVEQIKKQEQEVYKARKAYSDKNSALNKTNLEKEESNLKTLTDKYQLATGESWKDSKKMEEEITKAKQSATNERAKIDISAIRDERMRRAAEYDQQIKEIKQEEEAYKKSHNGRTSGEFNVKRENARIQYDLDIKEIDREFNEWIDSIQRETGNIDLSNYLNDLQLEIDIEPSYEIRKEKIDKLREVELRKVKEEGNRNKTEQLKEQFGDKSIELYNKLQEDGANREELLKGYANDLHTDVTILEQVMQQIDSASKALDAQTAAQVSAKKRSFENEDIQGVYSEYYAIGEGLANYAGYELKKKAIADKYNELRGKAELVKDKGTKEKMLATFSDMQDKELKQLENNFFMSLTTTNADGSEMSIAERLMGKNGNVKLIETVRLLKLLKKAKQEIDGSNDKKVSSETSNAITDLTGLSADEIESLAANSNDMAVAWEGVRDAISSSVTELSNINTGNQGIDKVLLGISQAAEIATDETAGLSDKINSSVNIIFNTLSGAFQMVAETMSMIGEASHNEEIMETAEVFSGIAQNFSAAGQGAATGGWIGAIVGGVTDALGQIINAVVQNTSAAHEAKVAYQQWADAAREVSYSQSMQSKNNIFGENNVDKLTTALDTLRKVKDDYLETIKGLEEASQKDAEELKNLLSAKNQLIASITIASLSVVGLLNGNIWQNWEKNKQALDEYKDSLYEVLVGGFYKNGKQNIDGFVKAVENGYSALEAMQIKTLDKSGSSKDEYKALKDLAPEVFNEDGSIDTEMLDAFMQAYGDKLTEEQRMLLERLKVQQDAYNEAFEQATEYYTNLFGNVGTSLMDAFESEMVRGEDALDNFTDSIADAVEEWVRQFAYMAYIQPYLMDATKMIEDAVSAEGATTESINAAMDEALAYIFGNFNEMQDGYTAFLQDAQGKYGDMFGMDLFQDADAEGSQGFGQMTQDQADTLTARFTAVQIEMANVSATTQAMAGVVSLVGEDIKLGVAGIQSLLYNSNIALQMAQDQLDQMQIIADNTAMLAETNARLKAIEQNTGRL